MGPEIASLYSSMIRTYGFRGDPIAIIMPVSVRLGCLCMHVCVCVCVCFWTLPEARL